MRVAKLPKRALSFSGLLASSLVFAAALLSTPKLGDYLEEHLSLIPMFKLRAFLGHQPELADAVRVIVADDSSIKDLGGAPTFSAWLAVAERLFEQGFERVLLQEPQDLAGQTGALPSRRPRGFLAVGVVNASQKSSRAVAASEIPNRVAIEAKSDHGFAFVHADALLAPSIDSMGHVDALGSNVIDYDTSLRVAPGLRISESQVIPHLALWASPSLRLDADGIITDAALRPHSADGKVYVDYVSLASVVARAIPVRAFFKDNGDPETHLGDKLKSRLAGGRIAVLVPAAFSGSRHVASPVEGLVPSYASLVSVVNSVVTGRNLYRPLPSWLILLVLSPVLFLVLRMSETRRAMIGAGGVFAAYLALSFGGFAAFGWLLPNAAVTIVTLLGVGARFGRHFMQTVSARGKLEHELQLGRTVQELLLPVKPNASVSNWEIFVDYQPHGALAGDWYQLWHDEQSAVVAIGDVVGKGASASLLTATIAGLWHDRAQDWSAQAIDVEHLTKSLDRTIHKAFRGRQNTTLALAILQERGASLCSYAAPGWFLIQPNQAPKRIATKSGNMLGLRGVGDECALTEVEVPKGSLLIAFTDGVADAPKAQRHFTKGLARIDFGAATTDADPVRAVSALAKEASQFNASPDDFTLVIVRRVA